jgi:hypothetical protein
MQTIFWLWALTGGAIATWVMMRFWLPRPLPIIRYLGVFAAGVIGAVGGGYLVHIFGSDPMPAIVAATAGGLILAGGASLLSTGVGNPG